MTAFAFDPDLFEIVLRDKQGTPLIGVVKSTGQMLFLAGGSRGRVVAAVAAQVLVTHQVGPTDATFSAAALVAVTTATTHNFSVTVTFTNEAGTAQTITLDFAATTGQYVSTITNAQGANSYAGRTLTFRAKANTTITVQTTGTFTTVVYNAEAFVEQLFAA